MVHLENIFSSANFDVLEGVLSAIKDDRLASLDLGLFQRQKFPVGSENVKHARNSVSISLQLLSGLRDAWQDIVPQVRSAIVILEADCTPNAQEESLDIRASEDPSVNGDQAPAGEKAGGSALLDMTAVDTLLDLLSQMKTSGFCIRLDPRAPCTTVERNEFQVAHARDQDASRDTYTTTRSQLGLEAPDGAPTLSSAPAYDILASLIQLVALHDALQRVLPRNIDTAISFLRLRRDALARHFGLFSLPNEILSRIFELGYWHSVPNSALNTTVVTSSSASLSLNVNLKTGPAMVGAVETRVMKSRRYALRISHVCRWFRMVALDSPELWCTISNWQSCEEIEECLYRSKAVDLWICYYGNSNTTVEKRTNPTKVRPASARELIMLALPHSRRWSVFCYQLDQSDSDSYEAQDELKALSLCQGSDTIKYGFPSLTKIWIKGCRGSMKQLPNVNATFRLGTLPFFKVLDFTGYNIHVGSKQVECLRSLFLDITHTSLRDQSLNLAPLINTLQACEVLEECLLRFRVAGEMQGISDKLCLHLSKLTSLNVDILLDNIEPLAEFISLMQAFHLPNLHHLTFALEYQPPMAFYCVDRSIEAIPILSAPRGKKSDTLQDIHIRFPSSHIMLQNLFDMIELAAPNLRRLTIEGKRVLPTHLFHLPTLPSLSFLTLHNCAITDMFIALLTVWTQEVLKDKDFLFTLFADRETVKLCDFDVMVGRLTKEMGEKFRYKRRLKE